MIDSHDINYTEHSLVLILQTFISSGDHYGWKSEI